MHPLARLALAPTALALFASASEAAQTWIAEDDPGGHFTSIQAAIDAAELGDRILVQPGSYSSFALGKGLTIVGYGKPVAGWAAAVDSGLRL